MPYLPSGRVLLPGFVKVWIKRLRKQKTLKIPLCNPSGGNVLLRQSCQGSTKYLFCENSQQPYQVDCFHRRAPPQISDRILNVYLTSGAVNVGVGGMQVHGILVSRLVYKEVVEALSNYKKSYFWWFGNPTFGDSTSSTWTEKDQAYPPPRPFLRKRREGTVSFSVVNHLWMIGLMVVVLMSYSRVVSVVLVLWRVSSVLTKGYEI